MGKTRLRPIAGAAAAAMALVGSLPALAQSRFLSYGTEAACAAGHVLTAALCRTAFANARAEFEARTTEFADEARCAKVYGSCAAWPPGARGAPRFRPAWDGVDIVDTPREKSVTPSLARAAKAIPFAPKPLVAFVDPERDLTVRPAPAVGMGVARAGAGGRVRRGAAAPEPPPGAPPPPGSGFKLEDGVLTYPAPARFQPKNLPRPR